MICRLMLSPNSGINNSTRQLQCSLLKWMTLITIEYDWKNNVIYELFITPKSTVKTMVAFFIKNIHVIQYDRQFIT